MTGIYTTGVLERFFLKVSTPFLFFLGRLELYAFFSLFEPV